MIKPNVKIIQESDAVVRALASVYIEDAPELTKDPETYDTDNIDQVRAMLLPNEIEETTVSPFSEDIKQMVKLLGAHCKTNSIDEINKVVDEIHGTLAAKDVSLAKNWVRILTGLHPQVDQHIKTLAYWKPYSELIGTNTIMYYADESIIDITMWSNDPVFVTNEVVWFTSPWESVSQLRESLREKLENEVISLIQNAGNITDKLEFRNIVYDATRTTESGTGTEVVQDRPIDPAIVHGVSLNNDWYNQYYRIMPDNKSGAYVDALNKLDGGGFFVHVLVNYLHPLKTWAEPIKKTINQSTPQGVEETFPRADSSIEIETDLTGNRIMKNPTKVDNKNLEPEKA